MTASKDRAKQEVKKTGKTGYQTDHEGTIKHRALPRLSDLKKVSQVKKKG